MKKIFSFVLIFSVVFSCLTFSASADDSLPTVYISRNAAFSGSASVDGDLVLSDGYLGGRQDHKWVTGTLFKGPNASTAPNHATNISNYTLGSKNHSLPAYTAAPSSFEGSEFANGTLNLSIDWSVDKDYERDNNYTLYENSYINTLTVPDNLTLNIYAESGTIRIIRVNNFVSRGTINVVGGGKVILYAGSVNITGNGYINATNKGFGDKDKFTLVTSAANNTINVTCRIAANIIVPTGNIVLNNVTMLGNVYVSGNAYIQNSSTITGLVFAPNSSSSLNGSVKIIGRLITKDLDISGSATIVDGGVTEIPSDLMGQLTESGSSSESEMVTVKVVTPKKMSVRLQNGTILADGSSFKMPKNGTVKFQMCTNNWDTGRYTDNGEGFAGTKVYTYTWSKSNKVLRTDTNKYFMAYRFYFKNGNYNKQTGISGVISKPVESWSVNLPLGSTITADAYKAISTKLASNNVFVETANDKTISFTNYYWQY